MYIYAKKEGMWMEGSQEVRKKRKITYEGLNLRLNVDF